VTFSHRFSFLIFSKKKQSLLLPSPLRVRGGVKMIAINELLFRPNDKSWGVWNIIGFP